MTTTKKRKAPQLDSASSSLPSTAKDTRYYSPSQSPQNSKQKARTRKSKVTSKSRASLENSQNLKEYIVRDILDEDSNGNLLVAWEDCGDDENSWEPPRNIGEYWIRTWAKRKKAKQSLASEELQLNNSASSFERDSPSKANSKPSNSKGIAPSTPYQLARTLNAPNGSATDVQTPESSQIELLSPKVTATQDQPRVSVSRPATFTATDYQLIGSSSQIPSSPASFPAQSSQSEADPVSSPDTKVGSPVANLAQNNIIPDSQVAGQNKSTLATHNIFPSQDASTPTSIHSTSFQLSENPKTLAPAASIHARTTNGISHLLIGEIDSTPKNLSPAPSSISSVHQGSQEAFSPQKNSPSPQNSSPAYTANEIWTPLPNDSLQSAPDKASLRANSALQPEVDSISLPPRPQTLPNTLTSTRDMNSAQGGDRSPNNHLADNAKPPITELDSSIATPVTGVDDSLHSQNSPPIDLSNIQAAQVYTPEVVNDSSNSSAPMSTALENIQAAQIDVPLTNDSIDTPIDNSQNSVGSNTGATNKEETSQVITVPIGLTMQAQTLYRTELKQNRKSINECLALNPLEVDSAPFKYVKQRLDTLNSITTHVDLINEDALTQEGIEDEHRYQWSMTTSSKFQFIKGFCDSCSTDETAAKSITQVAVFGKPGETLNLLESFANGANINYERPDTKTRSAFAENALSITILPTISVTNFNISPPDVIIGLDSTFDVNHQYIQELRDSARNDGKSIPIVELVIPHSAEHVQRSLPDLHDSTEKLRISIHNAIEQSKFMKSFEDEPDLSYNPVVISKFVVNYLLGLDALLKISELPPIEIAAVRPPKDLENAIAARSGTPKRSRELEDTTSYVDRSNKRPRGNNSPAAVNSSSDNTHVSESINGLPSSLAISQKDYALSNVEVEIRQENRKLRKDGDDVLASLKDHVKALEQIQTAYEAYMSENRLLRKEIDAANAAKAKAETRSQKLSDDNQALKKANATLKAEIQELTAKLQGHENPSLAEIGNLKSELALKETAESKLESAKGELEYIRTLYQTASQSAADSADEISELRSTVVTLEKKASGEKTKLREMFKDEAIRKAMDTAELKSRELASLKLLANQQEMELKELKEKKDVAKYSTRATSMGPSNRMPAGSSGSLFGPKRPITGSKNTSRANSRQSSPMPHGPSSQPAGSGSKVVAQHALSRT